MEVADAFRLEIRDLPAPRAVQRLQPEVVDAIVPRRIDHRFAIWAEADQAEPQPFKIQKFGLPGIGSDER